MTSWPPKVASALLRFPRGDDYAQLVAFADGHLELELFDGVTTRVAFSSVPIHMVGNGTVMVLASWRPGDIHVRVNGLELPQEGSHDRPIITLTSAQPRARAIGHPDATRVCQKWTNWRTTRFGKPRATSTPYLRQKILEEQTQELHGAITGLQLLVDRCADTAVHLTDYIAAGLRALVYWDESRRYDPLLLRVAARVPGALPLPVFALNPSAQNRPSILEDATLLYEDHGLSLDQFLPNHTLMDLQDWLESTVSTQRLELPSVQVQHVRAREVILQAASTIGASHYQQYVPAKIDMLVQTRASGRPVLFYFLVRVASVVVGLGAHVLARVE